MKRSVLLVTLCVLWSGVARPQSPQATARLYIFDLSIKTLIPSSNTVIDNGKKAGETRREHYLILQLAPGPHEVWLKYGPKGDRVQLDAQPGDTYYAVGGYHPEMPPSLRYKTFALIPKEQADTYLMQMMPMPPPAAPK